MDPNATIQEMRRISERLHCGEMDDGDKIDAAHRLAELFDALDEWILKGGFLPTSWREGQMRVL